MNIEILIFGISGLEVSILSLWVEKVTVWINGLGSIFQTHNMASLWTSPHTAAQFL